MPAALRSLMAWMKALQELVLFLALAERAVRYWIRWCCAADRRETGQDGHMSRHRHEMIGAVSGEESL